MTQSLLLSMFPLEDHAAFYARLTCCAINEAAPYDFLARLVTRQELSAGLLKTSLKDSADTLLAELDNYCITQVAITALDAQMLGFDYRVY